MINLRNDYCYIAHPRIIEKMNKLSSETFVGYGLDECSVRAKKLILDLVDNPESDIHFLVGGTITNKVLISHILKPYEAVISADTGHINVHETGTIEQSGHKVLTMPNRNAKVYKEGIISLVNSHTDEHMVKPKMVYISQSTEYGTIYSFEELQEISNVCKELGLYFFIDGARLGSALMSKGNNITLKDFGKLCDAFYIGGTKNGAMLGEALIINNPKLNVEIRYSIKHLGGMYAKGFIAGIQFETLFEDGLFFEIAKKENELADLLREELVNIGLELFNDSPTNQVFVVFEKEAAKKIKEKIMCEVFEDYGNKECLRFVTHYNLEKKDIISAINIIKSIVTK